MPDVFELPLFVLDPSGVRSREDDGRVTPEELKALSQVKDPPLSEEDSDVQIEPPQEK